MLYCIILYYIILCNIIYYVIKVTVITINMAQKHQPFSSPISHEVNTILLLNIIYSGKITIVIEFDITCGISQGYLFFF
jgi:hypothetical protein